MTTLREPAIDYSEPRAALAQILDWIEERVDPAHQQAVVERRIAALQWQPVDRPPVTFSTPAPEPFAIYPYHEAFYDPVKMLVNELVGPALVFGPHSPSIVNSVLARDDFPFQIRGNYGVGIIASLFGGDSVVVEGNMPWVRPIGKAALERCLARGLPAIESGILRRCLDTMAFYKEALAPYPRCRKALRITQPDLEGPFVIASQLWGGDIFTAFYDCPDFLRELLHLISETYVLACRRLAAESTESVRQGYIYLHFSICRGGCLIKDDSSIMLSPLTYVDFIRPSNEMIIDAMGGGGIHWCGKGDHWRSEFASTRGLTNVDWGNPEMLHLPAWAAVLGERRIPVSSMWWKLEALATSDVLRHFPTGACFTVSAASPEQAREYMAAATRKDAKG